MVKTDLYGNTQFDLTYGYPGVNWVAKTLIAVPDTGYAIAGNVLIKTDNLGNLQWNQSYGVTSYAMTLSSDGGFVLAGTAITPIGRYSNYDFALIKTDEFGIVPENWSLFAVSVFLVVMLPLIVHRKRLNHV